MTDEICYKRNFLTKVIIRIDLPSQLIDFEKKLVQIKTVIFDSFPLSETQKSIAQELKISPDEIKNKKTEHTIWVFRGQNNDKKLTIRPDAIFFEYEKYDSYNQVKNEFIKIINLIQDTYKELICSRLGVRYINEIDNNNLGEEIFKWDKYINKNLLGIFDFLPENKIIARAFNNLELNYGSYNLRFQFGMHNPDYPAQIKSKIFVLDYDAYFQGPLSILELPEMMDVFHTKIQETFELSITDNLREILNA